MSGRESHRGASPLLVNINRLSSDLDRVNDGIMLEGAVRTYFENDITNGDAVRAETAWRQLREAAYLDDVLLYEQPATAANYCRSLLATEVLSLYRNTHTADDFRAWAPRALRLALAGGQHSADVCPREWEEFDHTCNQGYCPVKGVTAVVEHDVYAASFDSLEYMYDPAGEREKTLALIGLVRKVLIVGEGEAYRLRRAYERRFESTFSYISNSTLRTDDNPV